MTTKLSLRTVALFAAVLLVAPAVFTAVAPRAQAVDVVKVASTAWQDIKSAVENTYTAVKSAITAIASVTSAAANTALVIDRYVLQPLAYIMTGNLLKSITASILGFVAGKNGLGKPLYVQNLRGYVQNVGDVEAYSFLNQFQSQSNSPFAGAIASSLRANYLQSTSAAGFFAANRSTLGNYSSNPNGFVNGSWDLGGWTAWMGLTTVPQNDPYTYYFIAQDQLYNQVDTAQSLKLAQVTMNQGFLSWCGSTGGASVVAGGTNSPSFATKDDALNYLVGKPVGTTASYPGGVLTAQGSNIPTNPAANVQPGDPCTRTDGTEGTIQTPGSVIATYLNNAIKATSLDKLVAGAGDLSTQVNGILGNVGTVFRTVDLATSLFGGTAGGFAGFSGSGGYDSPFASYLSTPGYLGMTSSSVYTNPITSGVAGSDLSSRVAQYQAAWGTIGRIAGDASSTLTALGMSCPAEASAAQSALISQVAPVLTLYRSAQATIATANALLAQTAADQASTTDNAAAYATDIALAQTTPPSAADIANAEAAAETAGLAQASPEGSLNVGGAGATTVDLMNLLAANASALSASSVCATSTPATPGPSGGGSDGGGGGGG